MLLLLLNVSVLGFQATARSKSKLDKTHLLLAKPIREGSMAQARASLGFVPYGEESRKYRRTVFEHKDWLLHRSNTRLFDNLKNTIKSGVVRSILLEVYTATSIAIFVCMWNALILNTPNLSKVFLLSLPLAPFTLSASSLGLLLVFRTNASYARWLEGRTTWGRIMAHSKNIVRQASVWTTGGREEMQMLRDGVWSFSRVLIRNLRGEEDETKLVAEFQERGISSTLLIDAKPSLRPSLALRELTLCMDKLSMDDKKKVEADKSVIIMGEACETVERIFSSPVPLVYTRHTARFLSSYLLLLPIGLWR